MEPKSNKTDSMSKSNIERIDPKDDWIDKLDQTHYMMIAMDILELDVEDSKLADAKQMLKRIGIKG